MISSPISRHVRANSGITFRPDANTVLWLPGQLDGRGATIKDWSGNVNHGTLVGVTWTMDHKGLLVLSCDGTDSYVTVTYDASLDVDEITFLQWIKKANTDLEYRSLASQQDKFYFRTNNNNTHCAISVYYDDATEYEIAAAIPLADTNWHQVGFIFNDTTKVVSGILDGAIVANSAAQVGKSLRPTTKTLFIGRLWWSTLIDFKGNIILSKEFNRALSTAEISNIFNQQRGLFGV